MQINYDLIKTYNLSICTVQIHVLDSNKFAKS